MSKANWFTNAATTRRIYELRQAKSEIDRFDNERLGIIDQLTVLLESQLRSRNGEQNRNPAAVRDQIKQAKALKSHLSASFDSFKTSIHRKRLSSDSHPADSNPALLEMKRALLERLESAIEPDVLKTISMIDSMIERAESAVK